MKILFITQFYPPEIGAASNRIGYFAQYLAHAGHHVSVLTTAPNYPDGKVYRGFKNTYSMHTHEGVTVHRTRVFLSIKKNIFGRIAHYCSFIISSLATRKHIEKPDIIIATSPPLFVGIIGVFFKRLWKVPLILDIRDLWPESVESVGIVKNRGLITYGHRLAQWIYKNADHITATSPGIQKNLHTVRPEKITALPNGAELELFEPLAKDTARHAEKIRDAHHLKNAFVALYTGNLGLAQAPEILVETAELLVHETEIKFLIVGGGVLLPKLHELARSKKLANIIFAGVHPRSEMPAYVTVADVCIIPYKKADTFRNTLPSKMFDYMAGGKAMIINLKGEASELIEKAGCGVCVKEEDAQALADAIKKLKNDQRHAKKIGDSGRAFVEKHFNRAQTAFKLNGLIAKVSGAF